MNLADLLNDAHKAGDIDGIFHVAMATRTVDGVEMEAGKVQVRDAGELNIDPSGEEIDILPAELMPTMTPALTIADIRCLVSEQPEILDFDLTAITKLKILADGGQIAITQPILGTYIPPEKGEIWLLLSPEKQWPENWFR